MGHQTLRPASPARAKPERPARAAGACAPLSPCRCGIRPAAPRRSPRPSPLPGRPPGYARRFRGRGSHRRVGEAGRDRRQRGPRNIRRARPPGLAERPRDLARELADSPPLEVDHPAAAPILEHPIDQGTGRLPRAPPPARRSRGWRARRARSRRAASRSRRRARAPGSIRPGVKFREPIGPEAVGRQMFHRR